MSTKHTQGPWRVGGGVGGGAGGAGGGGGGGGGLELNDSGKAQSLANANLIAELAEALKRLRDTQMDPECGDYDHDDFVAAWQQARAALAKAGL